MVPRGPQNLINIIWKLAFPLSVTVSLVQLGGKPDICHLRKKASLFYQAVKRRSLKLPVRTDRDILDILKYEAVSVV